jgi:hypothetical protein
MKNECFLALRKDFVTYLVGSNLIFFLPGFFTKKENRHFGDQTLLDIDLDKNETNYQFGPWSICLRLIQRSDVDPLIPLFWKKWNTVTSLFEKGTEKENEKDKDKDKEKAKEKMGEIGNEGNAKCDMKTIGITLTHVLSGQIRYYVPFVPSGVWVNSMAKKGPGRMIDPAIRSEVPIVSIRNEKECDNWSRECFLEVILCVWLAMMG